MAIGAAALGKGALALLTAAPTGGASLGVWAVTEKAVLAGLAIGGTWSKVAYEAANLENNRLAALYAFDALDTVLGELSEIGRTFTLRAREGAPLVPSVDALVRSYAIGQGQALDGYGLTVERFTLPSLVYTAANGIADAEGEIGILSSGTRAATPAPLLVVSSWNREGYEKVAVGSVEGLRTLAVGERATFTWRSSAVAFSVVPSNVDLTLGFGPQLVRVGYGAADVNQSLVVPPGATSVEGNISVVPVGAGTTTGSTVSFNHQPQATTAYVTFMLAFAFGDLDLHVYDGHGGHRGVNYSTGQIETSIPGEGPDPRGNPESIRVPATPGVTYRVEVVDRTGASGSASVAALWALALRPSSLAATADNAYRVTAIEEKAIGPILEVSPRELRLVLEGGATSAVGSISLREIGLQAPVSSLSASVSDLTGAGGETIPASQIELELGATSLQPGGSTALVVRVPMAGRRAFPYSGQVRVAGGAGEQTATLTLLPEASRIRTRLVRGASSP